VAVTRVVRGWRLEQEPRRFHFVRTSQTTAEHFFRPVPIIETAMGRGGCRSAAAPPHC
jgi:hypothetical protein